MNATKEHWENIFKTKSSDEVSWFQPYPKTSIEFVDLFKLPLEAAILDVGAGDSYFVDALIEKGYSNIHILDISEAAIEKVKIRLGEKAKMVKWIVADITDYKPDISFDFWHDRASFHFLTTKGAIEKYVSLAERSILPGGYLILGTFSEEGPTHCSGLEVKQYNELSIAHHFSRSFDRIKCIHENHVTPFNTTQHFLFCSFLKKNNPLDFIE